MCSFNNTRTYFCLWFRFRFAVGVAVILIKIVDFFCCSHNMPIKLIPVRLVRPLIHELRSGPKSVNISPALKCDVWVLIIIPPNVIAFSKITYDHGSCSSAFLLLNKSKIRLHYMNKKQDQKLPWA